MPNQLPTGRNENTTNNTDSHAIHNAEPDPSHIIQQHCSVKAMTRAKQTRARMTPTPTSKPANGNTEEDNNNSNHNHTPNKAQI